MKPFALALALIASLSIPCAAEQRSAAELMDILMWGREPIGGPFALTDHTGNPRSDEDFRGKLMLVYFGFTYCPDVCPADLMEIGRAIEQLGEAGNNVQPIFISVDPARDTPEHLKEYMPMFHPRFVGLTGDAAAIRRAADAYRVYYKRIDWDDQSNYTIDHSSFIYLLGADGKYLGFFPPGSPASRMAEAIRLHLSGTDKIVDHHRSACHALESHDTVGRDQLGGRRSAA